MTSRCAHAHTQADLGVRIGAVAEAGVLKRLPAADDVVADAIMESLVVLGVDVPL